MSAELPPKPASVPPPRRPGWRRVVWGLVLLLVLLGLFHRPLGHWAVRHFGGQALAKAGISGEWKTSGSLWNGLVVDDLKLTGNDQAQVRAVTLRHASLEYDLMALRSGGAGTVLKRLVVQDLTIDVDLTKPGPPRPPRPSDKPKTKPRLPGVVLPEVRIEHLTLRLKLPRHQLVVRDFNLTFDPSKPGIIEAAVLELPGTPRMENVRGTTRSTPQQLVVEDLVLWPGTVVDRLLVDLHDLPSEAAAFELAARQGPAQITVTGRSGNWFTSPTTDLEMEVRDISEKTLAFWGVPSGGTAWKAGRFQFTARGPVLRPDLLETSFRMEDGDLTFNEVRMAPVALQAAMKTGKLEVSRLSAAIGVNQISAHAQADLPPSWAALAKAPGFLEFQLTAPDLPGLLPPQVEATGEVRAQGRVDFDRMKLTAAGASLEASALQVQGIPMEAATARVSLADGVLRVDHAAVRLNEGNSLEASGQMALEAERAIQVQWEADVQDLTTVPAKVRAGLPWPEAGKVISKGTLAGKLEAWQAGRWDSLEGQATADLSGLKIKDAAMDSLRLRAQAKAGILHVDEFSVRLDETHRLEASGQMDLTDEAMALSGQVDLKLPDVARVSAWSTQFGGPALRAGRAEVDWQGSGQLQPLRMDSRAKVLAAGLRLEGVPEVLGLTAELTQAGGDIHLSTLEASAGPWRAAGSMMFDGWHLTIPRLEAFGKDQRLVDLSGRFPWHDGGMPDDSPLALRLKVDALDISRLAAALGRPMPVQGILNADADFSGTLRTLQGTLTAGLSGLRPASPPQGLKLEPAAVKVAIKLADGQLVLNGTALQKPLQPVTLTASMPLQVSELLKDHRMIQELPLTAQVKLPASSLAFLPAWIPALRALEGTASAEISVSGTLGRPVWQGGATVSAPRAAFLSGSLPTVRDLRLKVRINERRIQLDEASVMLAGGRLRVEGGAGLENPLDPLLDLKLAADEILIVRDDNISLRANAGITCQGPFTKAAVHGQIDLVRGRVFKEIEFLPLSLPDSLPPPPPSTTLGRQGPPALPPPFDQWTVDISIKTRDPVRLMGNVARGNAVVDLKLAGTGARPDLTGTVRLEEMWLKLPFSRLTVTEGVLTFNKEQPFDPRISIIGESITGSRIVQVFVDGRALDPRVRLTSSPPLPEGEIAALLATGVTTSDLTGSGNEAAGRAAFVLIKQTYRKLFRKAATSTDDDEPPRLSFDLSVFGSDPERRGVSAIYELNPRWRLIGRVGETGTFRGLLHYLIRFR